MIWGKGYFTGHTDQALIPFFSRPTLNLCVYTILILSVLGAMFWPWQGLLLFMKDQRVPMSFPLIVLALLAIQTYINIRLGRGEFTTNPRFLKERMYQTEFPVEVVVPFFRDTLPIFSLHIAFLLLPAFPILLIFAAVSGFAFIVILKTLAIVFTAALLCRLFAFMMYLLWGNTGLLGYFFARVFLFVSIYLSAFVEPPINPIRLLYSMNFDVPSRIVPLTSTYQLYMALTIGLIGVLSLLCEFLGRRRRRGLASEHAQA